MSTRPWEEGVMHAGSNQNAPSMYIIILAMPMGDLLVCKPPANIAALLFFMFLCSLRELVV